MGTAASNQNEGYWGHTDSLKDWCEGNYVVSHYFAEFYNTFSSLPITCMAILGLSTMCYSAIQRVEWRHIVVWNLLGIVGLGSALFHMTLRYWGQIFDVLPMMMDSVSFGYCLYMTDSEPNVSYWKTDLTFISWALFICFMYLYTKIHLLFFLIYGVQTVATIIVGYRKTKRWANPLAIYLFHIAWCLYGIGWALWVIDQNFCEFTQPYHLHSIWHLCAGYGSYCAIYSCVVTRAAFLSQKCKLKMLRLCHVVPVSHYVVYVQNEEDTTDTPRAKAD